MIVSAFTYNGEKEILDIHLNVLNDKVDEFIIIEAPTTFSGKKKPLYFENHEHLFKEFLPKIKYHVIDEDYSPEEISLAKESPNTKGATHWTREFLQKESIKKALTHLNDEDIVIISDVDEIWELPPLSMRKVWKLKLRVYTYYLNNRSSEEFWGPIIGKYKHIKNECLNHARTNAIKTEGYYGWHFTSLRDELERKLTDSYTEETYASKWVLDNLSRNIAANKDFLGRDFIYYPDETNWPRYLKENKHKYKNLCRQ